MSKTNGNICEADDAAISLAAARLAAGDLIAFPTETVYGLGANALLGTSVARIFEAKGRPQFNPLIVHLADGSAVHQHAHMSDEAAKLADAFWPGPLTLVLRRRSKTEINELVSAGGETIALRVPAHPVARALLNRAGCPVAAPSANLSGRISPTTAAHVHASLGWRVDCILDGGHCPGGLESTIVDMTEDLPVLLRSGLLERESISAVVGDVADPPNRGPVRAPGMLESHYAPTTPLRTNASNAGPGEAFLGFGPDYADDGDCNRNLSPAGELVAAAANLFSMLHELDALGADGIAVSPIPESGLGVAINDRLRRAAAPRTDNANALLDD
jgi:L-threonylcarbamoyladenylate synthase